MVSKTILIVIFSVIFLALILILVYIIISGSTSYFPGFLDSLKRVVADLWNKTLG